MIKTSPSSIQQRIKRLVDELLGLRDMQFTVEPDDPLIDSGLTSLDVVRLVFLIEADLNIEFPPNDITPANFRTLDTINTLVSRLQGAAK